jgi:hypothetical protein
MSRRRLGRTVAVEVKTMIGIAGAVLLLPLALVALLYGFVRFAASLIAAAGDAAVSRVLAGHHR